MLRVGGRERNKLRHSIQRLLHSAPKPTTAHFSSKGSKNKALAILNIISSKPPSTNTLRQTHLRLLQDLFNSPSVNEQHATSSNPNVLPRPLQSSSSSSLGNQHSGATPDARSLSTALTACASSRDLRGGTQCHAFATTTGLLSNSYVSTSLITLYSRCAELDSAHKVFHEMPMRNVVTWTAIISAFAQDCQVDVCLELFSVMRNSTLTPNDLTFTSLLSACTGSGALGQGTSAHCQIIQMGFHSYLHIANALISMYCKCGSIHDALYVFDTIFGKDIVSWNSMISGYAQHGLAMQAVQLFEDMKKLGVEPDSITFLSVLSACRHAGLVLGGRNYFNSMVEYGLKPQLDHYSCLVDLLGRAGLIEEARDVILGMPVSPNAVIWGSLLSSCRLHGSVWIGIQAAEQRLLLEPSCAATHVQLANLYASVRYWKQAARIRKLMKDTGLKTNPGCSWIEIKNKVHRFRPDDSSNARVGESLTVLGWLGDHMMTFGYVPEMAKL